MNNVAAQGQAQLGGVSRIFFVEHRLVRRWPQVLAGQLTTAHALSTGVTFAQLEGTAYTPALDADASDSQHGTSYNQVLEGFYAGDAPEVAGKLATMHGRRFLVLIRYFNGTIVAVGDR